jgi:DinB superfamily
MRRSFLVGMFLNLTVVVGSAEPPITDLERQRLVAHMEMTASWLEDEVRGLSAAQATFRPARSSWTILEVLDHLVVVGPIYWKDLQSAKEVSAGRAGMMNDVDVLWYGIDRTNRETALGTEEPSHKLQDVLSGLNSYRTQHARLLQYIRTTKDDLRGRIVERQNSDAYQWALLTSTHEQRHILQIREIKRDAKFPKQ